MFLSVGTAPCIMGMEQGYVNFNTKMNVNELLKNVFTYLKYHVVFFFIIILRWQ